MCYNKFIDLSDLKSVKIESPEEFVHPMKYNFVFEFKDGMTITYNTHVQEVVFSHPEGLF